MDIFALIITGFMLVFSVLIFWYELSLLISISSGSPYINAKRESVHTMISLAKIKQNDVVYDLGSGDGRLVFLSAPLCQHAVGIEINAPLIIWCRIKKLWKRVKNVTFVKRNIWKCDFSKADVVFIYLLPPMIAKLEPILMKELKKGSRIISKDFPFPNIKPKKEVDKIYLYVV